MKKLLLSVAALFVVAATSCGSAGNGKARSNKQGVESETVKEYEMEFDAEHWE